jgi:tetratricopeptide (TPR) repeat protein
LIDCYNRNGELFQYKEQFQEAITSFNKVVDLCAEDMHSENRRIMSSALYSIGYCHQQLNQNEEAKQSFLKAVEVMRTSLIIEINKTGKQMDNSVTNEVLIQPSIFDTDYIKDMKEVLADILFRVQETKD